VRIIVASNTHSLLPVAWRLHKEGHDVTVIVMKDRYEKCWQGLLPKELRGKEKARDGWTGLVEEAQDGAPVLTDSERALQVFNGSPRVYGGLKPDLGQASPLMIGAWHEEGRLSLPHLLVIDWGLWPAGLGAWVPGGATLIQPPPQAFVAALQAKLPDMVGHRGLVASYLRWNPNTSEYEAEGLLGGWSHLHMHLFISNLTGLGSLIEGVGAGIDQKYVVGVPVTVPPFPILCNVNSDVVPIQGLQDTSDVFFHDMFMEDQQIYVAGTDGLVAVVRGSANHLGLARQKALGVASQMVLPQKQARSDAAQNTDAILGLLESQGIA
jgi:hypothetical protein